MENVLEVYQRPQDQDRPVVCLDESWLDMAESELSVLSRQCIDRRISDKRTLIEEVAAWQHDRNKNHAKADWQFTTTDARIELTKAAIPGNVNDSEH
jgi:hypothetical protein